MNLVISGHGVEVTPSMRHHAQTKAKELCSRFNSILGIRVIFRVKRERATDTPQEAQILIKMPNHEPIRLKHAGSCAYQALTELARKAHLTMANMKNKNKVARRSAVH